MKSWQFLLYAIPNLACVLAVLGVLFSHKKNSWSIYLAIVMFSTLFNLYYFEHKINGNFLLWFYVSGFCLWLIASVFVSNAMREELHVLTTRIETIRSMLLAFFLIYTALVIPNMQFNATALSYIFSANNNLLATYEKIDLLLCLSVLLPIPSLLMLKVILAPPSN